MIQERNGVQKKKKIIFKRSLTRWNYLLELSSGIIFWNHLLESEPFWPF
jgi:hypothetical protein